VRVDAHQHFWDPAAADYPWLTDELAVIRRAFGPGELAPLVAAAGIDATVLVQTRSSLDETRQFLATASTIPFVRGVVGWVDLTDPAVADSLADLRSEPGGDRLVGIRHQVHDEDDPDWLLREAVRRGLRAVAQADLAYDLLVRPRELPAALRVAQENSDLRLVIDHLAKPPIREGSLEPWASLIRPFGRLENVTCKVSGLITEAAWDRWRVDDLVPFVEVAMDVFGPARLMFGSDWPVCLVAGSYAQIVDAARELSAGWSAAERVFLFGRTASRVYGLDATR